MRTRRERPVVHDRHAAVGEPFDARLRRSRPRVPPLFATISVSFTFCPGTTTPSSASASMRSPCAVHERLLEFALGLRQPEIDLEGRLLVDRAERRGEATPGARAWRAARARGRAARRPGRVVGGCPRRRRTASAIAASFAGSAGWRIAPANRARPGRSGRARPRASPRPRRAATSASCPPACT